MSPSVHQTSYRLSCEMLGGVLVEVAESGPSAVGLVQCRATAALYRLLMNHPVDRRGRCRSCRRPGTVLGWWHRRCRVRVEAAFWLHHPDDAFLLSQLVREFGLDEQSGSSPRHTPKAGYTVPADRSTGEREHTEQIPKITAEPVDSDSGPLQSPAVSPPPVLPGGFPRARRPDPDHGEAREQPERRQSGHGPSGDPDDSEPPVPDGLLLASRSAA